MTTSFSACETIGTAWRAVKGCKASFFAACAIIGLISLAILFVGFIASFLSTSLSRLIDVVYLIINLALQTGLLYMGIERVKNKPISHTMIWHMLQGKMLVKIISVYILWIIVCLPAIILGVLAAHAGSLLGGLLYLLSTILYIYLMMRLYLSFGFLIDQACSPLDAIKLSFESTRDHVGTLFLISVANFIIVAISMIPLGIGLIWSIPYVSICYGVIYQKLFIKNSP